MTETEPTDKNLADSHLVIIGRVQPDLALPPKPLTTVWVDAKAFGALQSLTSPVLGRLQLVDRALAVWVEPIPAAVTADARKRNVEPAPIYMSQRMLTRLSLTEAELADATLTIDIVRAKTAVMSVSEPLGTSQASISEAAHAKLGNARFGLVQGKGHALFVHLRTKHHATGDDVIRLNYNARTLLGVSERHAIVDIQRLDTPELGIRELGFWRATRLALARGVTTGVEATLRLMLGAPRVALAVRVASDGDDEIGICRCAPDVLDRIGVVSGGTIRLIWGSRAVTSRIYARTETSDRENHTFVVDWGDDHKLPSLHENQYISVPSGIRSRLGVPRDGVVEVRRSMVGILRRRFVDLAVPVVGIVISIGPLGLNLWVAGALLLGSFVLILAGERLGKARSPLRTRDPLKSRPGSDG